MRGLFFWGEGWADVSWVGAGLRNGSDVIGDDVGGAVGSGEEGIGVVVVGEFLGFGVHTEEGAEGGFGDVEVDLVLSQVFGHAIEGLQGDLVGLDLLLDGFGGFLRTQAVGDVTGMAEGGGEVTFEDIGGEVGVFTGADGLDPVGVVGAAAGPFFDFLAVFIEGGGVGIGGDDHGTAFAVDDDADACAAVFVGFEAADFEDEGSGGVVVEDELCIGGFAVVGVAESAADGEDARGEVVFAEDPTGDVHLVDALVAEVAGACSPDPVPVVVEAFSAEGVGGCGSTPEVVVEGGWEGLRAVGFADGGAGLVAEAAGEGDFAEVSLVEPFDGVDESAGGAALGAGLDDAVVFSGGLDGFSAFEDVV